MEKKRKLPILSVLAAGTPEFPRYLISDDRDRFWTGRKFCEAAKGVLYGSHEVAALDIHAILKGHFQGAEPQRYVVPLYVEVLSHDPVHDAQVVRHLSKASRLYLDTDEHGNGLGDSLVLPWIEWHRIEKLEKFPDD